MIRQAISCDICGTEKRQTNHWFVACENNGELRISGWSSRPRGRAGVRHLCGQTCLHKLVDEFMARTIAARPPAGAAVAEPVQRPAETDASLTSTAAFHEKQIPVRVMAVPEPIPSAVPSTVLSMPLRTVAATAVPQIEDPPKYASRRWHAEAWQRERDRERRANEG